MCVHGGAWLCWCSLKDNVRLLQADLNHIETMALNNGAFFYKVRLPAPQVGSMITSGLIGIHLSELACTRICNVSTVNMEMNSGRYSIIVPTIQPGRVAG